MHEIVFLKDTFQEIVDLSISYGIFTEKCYELPHGWDSSVTECLQPKNNCVSSTSTQFAVHNISSVYFRIDHPPDCSKKPPGVAKTCQRKFSLAADFLSLITPAVTFTNTLCPSQLSHILQTPKTPNSPTVINICFTYWFWQTEG